MSAQMRLAHGEGRAKCDSWPVLSKRGMDGHGQARTNTDGMVKEYGISQDPPAREPLAKRNAAGTTGCAGAGNHLYPKKGA
jgi:hypothetical protein